MSQKSANQTINLYFSIVFFEKIIHRSKLLQRKKASTPNDSYINSAVENTYFFCVRYLEGRNYSQQTVLYF